ncbi:zinc-dependent metalloprotease family protein [Bradyrhizobium sp. 23]|uniref:zinc-dependent metalloprotease family protein n=1 Tax=Bradyrhizobium sp. 23 TaxID=2782667 RepID=UPI001FF883D4|nr:zinc-dependent metalloprotease family protein [Bradyrhizobium sp. 23]MCK1316808.1 hypothetical protein [Bradyrhizobium sp. 23]
MFYRMGVSIIVVSLVASATLAQDARPQGANTELFKQLNEGDLTPEQSRDLQKIRNLKTTVDAKVISLDVEALRSASTVTVRLDSSRATDIGLGGLQTASSGSSDKYIAGPNGELSKSSALGTTTAASQDFARVGSISPSSDNPTPRKSIFHVEGNRVFGSIFASDAVYDIRPIAGGSAHVLIKVDQTKFPPEHPPASRPDNRGDLPPDAGVVQNSQLRKPNDSKVYDIRVLVGYTPAVKAAVDSPAGLIGLAIDATNSSYQASKIRAKAVLAGTVEVNLVESGNFSKDLAALRTMQSLREARHSANANVVVVLVNESQACGLASQIYANPANAYAVVYYDCAVTNLSFPHEIGHLQGARHNPEEDSAGVPFAYGHGFLKPTQHVRDIMAYDCAEGCVRQPQWSAPPDFGTPDRSNAAKVIDETAPYVASLH